MKRYDSVISLGGCCATANQLRRRNLRPRALGLDWIGTKSDPQYVNGLIYGLKNRFADVCLKDNLAPIVTPDDGARGYVDTKYHFLVMHSFHLDSNRDEGWYEADIGTIRKRFNRMFETIDRSSSVLFIYCSYFSFDLEMADELLATLMRLCSGKRIDLRIMQFNAPEGPYCRDLGHDNMEIFRYPRPIVFEYDLRRTSSEWAFLDDIRLTGADGRGLSGLDRQLYRIWKKISKRLRSRGVDLDERLSLF